MAIIWEWRETSLVHFMNLDTIPGRFYELRFNSWKFYGLRYNSWKILRTKIPESF